MSDRRPIAWLAGLLCIVGVTMMATSVGAASPARPATAGMAGRLLPGRTPNGGVTGVAAAAAFAAGAGSQGTDTAIAPTKSALTVSGRDTYSNLAITVNQTKNLTNQTVSINWTGGTPTVQGPGRFGTNFMQIMQCWGEDDGTDPSNPGPPPEQCEQGAAAGTYAGLPQGIYPNGFALSRVISRPNWPNYDPKVGYMDPKDTLGHNVWVPFRSVDGTEVPVQLDVKFNPSVVGGNYWLNPYFNIITTNENAGAPTGSDGKGAELFQVETGVESTGLGCGQKVQPVAGGGTKVPKCWIVVVPRGGAADENAGTPFVDPPEQYGVYTSPLTPSVWKHRIAIPIDFNPVDSSCALGADELRISGTEMALPAIASWQVPLCGRTDLQPFSYAPVSDDSARMQLSSGVAGGPSMIVVSKPLSPVNADPNSPVVYAPVSLSGLAIAFNIERNPKPDAAADYQAIAGVRVAKIHLTPRLIAKLLTQSYGGAVSIEGVQPYPWVKTTPAHMGLDPDFLQFNPEFAQLQIADSRTFSGLSIEGGNSDAAEQVWQYVLADPEARAFLSGKADPWGMKVNPVYDITTANPSGIPFASPVPNSFPKSDPYCYQSGPVGLSVPVTPPILCGTDWMPYTRGFLDSARIARIAFDAAKVSLNIFAVTPADAWQKDVPQFLGRRAMLTLTDTPSAQQFGLQVADLSAAGDDTAGRSFVAPDTPGLAKGVSAMKATTVKAVLEPDPAHRVAGAYPLTTLTYAALKPLSLDTSTRRQFSELLKYAAGAGQVPGLELGQLPRGYAPLPAALKSQALATASTVRTMQPIPTTTTTVEPSTTVVSTTAPATTQPVTYPVTTPYVPPTTEPTTIASQAPTTTAAVTTTTRPSTTTTAPAVTTTTVAELTPTDPAVRGRFALPGLGFAAAGSALGALEITKRPRRARKKSAS